MYLNQLVAQDQRAVQRGTRPRLGCKSFNAAQATLVGVERLPRLKKRQMMGEAGDKGLTPADQCYALAA